TKEIAQSFGARIYDYTWNDSFADARNFALEQSASDWRLVLDADEYIVNDARQLIRSFIAGKRAIGRLKIVNKFVTNNEVSYVNNYIPRLFPSDVRYEGRIHEQPVSGLSR